MPHAKVPVDMSKIPQEHLDKEILRTIMMTSLNAINLYDQMCYNTPDGTDLTDLIDEMITVEKSNFEKAEELLEKLDEEHDEDEDE